MSFTASAAFNRIVVVLAGDKDTIYAVNRSSIFYYAMLFGVMAMFKALMTSSVAAPSSGANAQFAVILGYFFISVMGLVVDDENGYTKAKKK